MSCSQPFHSIPRSDPTLSFPLHRPDNRKEGVKKEEGGKGGKKKGSRKVRAPFPCHLFGGPPHALSGKKKGEEKKGEKGKG